MKGNRKNGAKQSKLFLTEWLALFFYLWKSIYFFMDLYTDFLLNQEYLVQLEAVDSLSDNSDL